MRKYIAIIGLGILGSLFAPKIKPAAQELEQEFREFLEDFEAKAIPLSVESGKLSFNAMITGTEADYEKSAQSWIALEKIYCDTAAFAKIKRFRDIGQIADPVLKRQLDILYLSFLGSQIDPKMLEEMIRRQTEIEKKFNTFRAEVNGELLSDNQADSILRYSTNSGELEAVWKAGKKIGREIASDLIELIRLRNRAAEKLGFDNYYQMQLELGEQNPEEIEVLFDKLDALTAGAFTRLKDQIDSALAVRYNISKEDLRPWHYQNRFFQEAPAIYGIDLDRFYRDKDPVAISRAYFNGIGLPVDSILAHSDLYEKPGKYQHAQCSDIDRNGDVRVICNLRPDYYWMGTILHELGHGVHDYYNDRQKPWLLRPPAHSFTTEAVAEFFELLSANPQWMIKVAGAPKEEIEKIAEACDRHRRLDQLVFSRWSQVMVRFERALYENPDQDLNELWWDLVEKYQGIVRPEGRDEPDWAAKIHIATTPVYYHNYLMGYLLASQLAAAIARDVYNAPDSLNLDFSGNPAIGKFFIERVFHPGQLYPWNEMILRATGEFLTPLYYARQFVER
jgi:peptidyl-dipeptidase A